MQITTVETFVVPPRWVFLKLTTDEGIEGWGEPVIEGRSDAIVGAVQDLKEYVIGRDPADIEDIWQILYRGGFYRGGPILMSALSGFDQALWDIKGKALGVPVYQLLGGAVRNKIRAYSWIGGDRPVDVGVMAKERLVAGFTAIKMNATEEMAIIDSYDKVDAVIARVAAVRESTHGSFGIGVDFHGRVHKAMAKVIARELEPFRLLFIEEPVLPEHDDALREVARHTTIPIATGERRYSRWDFKRILQDGYVDIIQPDVSHAGGISETRRICAMAEAYDVAVALHCPLGPIALAACLQVDAGTSNAFIQEQSAGIHYNEGADLSTYLAQDGFQVDQGFLRIPTAPGLGVTIDEERVRAAQTTVRWKSPIWRLPDGSLAEW